MAKLKKKSLVESKNNLYYYQCYICYKKWDEVNQVEFIDRGGLDDMPSIEYRNECPSCKNPVIYVDDYKKKQFMDRDREKQIK